MSELPLVLFTVFSQMAVGLVAALTCMLAAIPAISQSPKVRIFGLAVCPLISVALIASLFHLGSPFGAFYALSGLSSAWLSREAFAAVVFFIFAGFYSYTWFKGSKAATLKTLGIITTLAGVVLVFCSAKIYMLPAHPTWNSPVTIAKFFLTSFVFSALFSTFIAVVAYGDASMSLSRGLSYTIGVLTIAVFLTSITEATATVPYAIRIIGSIALPIIGCMTFYGLRPSGRVWCLLFACVLIGEIAARTIFYTSVMSTPGF